MFGGGRARPVREKEGQDAGGAVLGPAAGGVQPDLRRQGGVDMPGLPGGMGPVRRTVGTAAFPLPQLVGVALHLHGEHVHALKAAEKILHPERAFAHHMIHDDPAPGLRGRGHGPHGNFR